MINRTNYSKETKTIDFSKLPKEIKDVHVDFDAYNEFYNEDQDIKEMIDLYLDKLNELVKKKDNQEPKSKKKSKAKPTIKANPTKPKPEKTKPKVPGTKLKSNENFKHVEDISKEIKFIKRYLSLNGKTKTKKQILTFLASLQNAILKKEIRKTSAYAKQIQHIQSELISLLSFFGKSDDSVVSISIKSKTVEQYKELSNTEKLMPSIRLISRYNRLQGKSDVKIKAKNLLKSIVREIDKGNITHYQDEIKEIKKALEDYVSVGTPVLKVKDENLKGFNPKQSIVSSTEFSEKAKFKPLQFTGKWKTLIGCPVKPFSMMTYAKPGQGKSTMNIEFAHYLASDHNKKVLFIADEEKLGYTLQEKLKRLKASHPNLFITDALPNSLKMFDFVFYDSVNSMGLSAEDLKELKAKNKQTSFIYIFQSTKDGNFKGNQEYSHDVDVVIEVEKGMARTEKSRFGGNGEIKVY